MAVWEPTRARPSKISRAPWEPTRARRSEVVTYRLTRTQALIQGFVSSQFIVFVLACLAVPDGGDGGNSGPVDVPTVVRIGVVAYLVVTAVGMIAGYLYARHVAVEVGPDGYTKGKKTVAWAKVGFIRAETNRLGGRYVKTGAGKKDRLPAPVGGRFGPNPDFDLQVAAIRNLWDRGLRDGTAT